jgi:hypothetical protein
VNPILSQSRNGHRFILTMTQFFLRSSMTIRAISGSCKIAELQYMPTYFAIGRLNELSVCNQNHSHRSHRVRM